MAIDEPISSVSQLETQEWFGRCEVAAVRMRASIRKEQFYHFLLTIFND